MSVFWTAGYAAAATQPMKNSRILYKALDGTVTASLQAEGFEAVNAARPDTYSYWNASSTPASWQIDFGSAQLVDSVGIAAHQLAGGAVAIDTWSGSAWVEQITASPSDNSAILLLFAAVSTQKVRLRVSGLAEALVGVIYAGKALEITRPAYASLGMIDLMRQTEFRDNESEGGQWVGRSIGRTALAASYSWDMIDYDDYRTLIDPFSRQARLTPFFLAARPAGNPTETVYGWVRADIKPERMGMLDFVRFGFDLIGYARD